MNLTTPRLWTSAFAVALLLNVSLGSSRAALAPEFDDFNDGDDVAWLRYDPLSGIGGTHAQFFLTNGGYRIRALASPIPASYGPGRAGSIRTQIIYTNFYASVDLVAWNTNLTQSVGLIGHARELGLGMTDGYALTFNFGSDHSGNGNIDITRFLNENPAASAGGQNLPLTADPTFRLVAGRSYRFVWIYRDGYFYARIFELPNLTTPLVDVSTQGPDSIFPYGNLGLLVYDASTAGTGTADATFDNYRAQEVESPKLTITYEPAFQDVLVRWPIWATEFQLQCAEVLSTNPAAWINVSGSIDNLVTNFQYQPNSGFPQKYFRLVR
jgi:hypothetical protein